MKTLCHNLFRSDGGLYAEKLEGFEQLLADRGDDLDDFVERTFGDQVFAESRVGKTELILELLRDQMSPRIWRFVRDRLRANPYLTDRRHTEEYAFDVALGWLEEELLISALENVLPEEAAVHRIGVDAHREFLSLNIRATADVGLELGDRMLRVDLFVDHKGTWRRNRGMDLKKGKLGHFRKGKLDVVLGLDLLARRFHLVDAEAAVGVPTFNNAAMGGTETARVPCGQALRLDVAARRLVARLKRAGKSTRRKDRS